MTNEQEIFALMQMAKDQQEAVEQAVAGLDERRRELGAVITQMRSLEASVAEEAKKGAQAGLQSMSSKAISALDSEVERAKRLIGEGAETLRQEGSAKDFTLSVAACLCGIAIGFALNWYMLARDTRATVDRLNDMSQKIEHRLQGMEQQQANHKPMLLGHSTIARKPKPMQQVQAPQEQP